MAVERLLAAWRATEPLTTVSIGLAVNGAAPPPETLEAADAALYRAKATGKDRVCSSS